MSSPLLELDHVRAVLHGVPVLESLSLRTEGTHVGLSGATRGLTELLLGRAEVTSGAVRVLGYALSDARARNLLGCAVQPAAVPKSWTVRRVIERAAQMSGCSQRVARARATWAAEQLGETAILKNKWAAGSPVEQELAALALGLANDPRILFVRLPTGRFEPELAARYGDVLERATRERALLVEIPRPPRGAELAWVQSLQSTSYVVDHGASVSRGAAGAGHARYLLRVAAPVATTEALLQQLNVPVLRIAAPATEALGQAAFLLDLPRGSAGEADTGTLIGRCLEAGVSLRELRLV